MQQIHFLHELGGVLATTSNIHKLIWGVVFVLMVCLSPEAYAAHYGSYVEVNDPTMKARVFPMKLNNDPQLSQIAMSPVKKKRSFVDVKGKLTTVFELPG